MTHKILKHQIHYHDRVYRKLEHHTEIEWKIQVSGRNYKKGSSRGLDELDLGTTVSRAKKYHNADGYCKEQFLHLKNLNSVVM